MTAVCSKLVHNHDNFLWPGIKQEAVFVNWDDPQEALLSLSGCVENHMGGTSGAVSQHWLTWVPLVSPLVRTWSPADLLPASGSRTQCTL